MFQGRKMSSLSSNSSDNLLKTNLKNFKADDSSLIISDWLQNAAPPNVIFFEPNSAWDNMN